MTLNNNFPGGWIGRRGPKKLPLWSWAKEEVCQPKPKTPDETEQQISDN
jgi:hypothetical protein